MAPGDVQVSGPLSVSGAESPSHDPNAGADPVRPADGGVEEHWMPNGSIVWYRDSDHAYWERYDDSTKKCSGRVAGCSTIAKNDGDSNKDGLLDWAAKLTCEGVVEYACDPDRADLFGDPRFEGAQLHEYLKEAKLTWRDVRDRAGKRGTVSHNVLQSLAEGVVPGLDSGCDKAVVSWWKHHRPDPTHVEQVVYDADRGFAGRFDLMYGETLLDLKTSKYLSNSFAVQLNLYALGMKAAGFTAPKRLAILHVKDDGSWAEVEIPLNPAWALNALATYRAGQEIRKAMRQSQKVAEHG